MVAFDVDLPSYHGPLDLLLYLIRREELEIEDIALAKVTQQYLQFLEVLQQLDLDNIGEFIEVVSILIEIKAERVLPLPSDQASDALENAEANAPHLIERLIQYKRFRDLACVLDEQSRQWQLRYRRLAPEPIRKRSPQEEAPIAKVEIWDLVSAFGRILRARQQPPTEAIRYDETPIHVYMERIHQRVRQQERIELQELFEPGMHKSALVGLFLATLELTRYHGLAAEQAESEGALWITKGQDFRDQLEVVAIENPEASLLENSNLPIRPR